MIELQFLNKILTDGNFQIVLDNEITEQHFPVYQEHFKFIKEHYDLYNKVPDLATFIDTFSTFDVIEVNESYDFLLNKLNEQYAYTTLIPHLEKINGLIKNKQSDKALEYWLQIGESDLKHHVKSNVRDLIADAQDRLDEYLIKSRDLGQFYYKTGLPQLDEIIGGWDAKEDFIVLAARSNIGKTWWLIFFALYQAKLGHNVGFVTIEMTTNKIGYRLDTFETHLSNWSITRANVNIQAEYEAHIKSIKENIKGSFKVLEPNSFMGGTTVSQIKNFMITEKIDFVFIDYFTLLSDETNYKNVTDLYVKISAKLKQLQIDLRKPIMLAAQLNRSQNEFEGRPGLDNIAGTAELGRHATTVLFLEKKGSDDSDSFFTLSIGKARDAKVGSSLNYTWRIDTGQLIYLSTEDDALSNKRKVETMPKPEKPPENLRSRRDSVLD